MKRLFLSLMMILSILFSINQSYAIPPVSQLGHQSWGAPAQRIAVKVGNLTDTVFVGLGTEIRAYEVTHASPGTPSEITGLKFFVQGTVNTLTIHPNNSFIFVGHSNGLKVRNYITSGTNDPVAANGFISDIVLNNNGTTAFVSMNGGTVKILDITSPLTPSLLGSLDFSNYFINSLAFRSSGSTDTLFLAGSGFKALRIYNVTTPSSPALLATSLLGDSVLNNKKNFKDVIVISDSIYIADSDSGLRIFNRLMADQIGKLSLISGTYTNYLSAKGDTAIIISNGDGFRVRKMTASSIIMSAATPLFHTTAMAIPNETVAGWGNLHYYAFGTKGFQIYSVLEGISVSRIGQGILTGDNVYDVVGDDRNYAYIANGLNGVHIINLTNHNPVSSNLSYQSGESYKKVLVQENKLYAFWDNGFNIVNVNNPSSPALLGTYTTGISGIRDAAFEDSSQITTFNDSVLVIADNNGIKLLNVKNPQNVSQYCSINLPGGCNHVLMDEQIYAAPGYGNLAIWRTRSNNFFHYSSPSFQDSTAASTLPPASDFAKDGRYFYYLTGDSVLKLDCMAPTGITNLGSVYNSPGGQLRSVDVAGNFLHIGTNNNRIFVIDSTNNAKKDSFTVQDAPSRIKINGLNLLVAANGDGYYHLSDPYGAARIRVLNATGMPKDTVTIPVLVLDNLSQLGALSFEMFFPFDSNRISFVNLIRGHGLPPGDSLLYTIWHAPTPFYRDTLKIVHADTGSITGVDTLFKLQFRINNNAPVSPLIQSTDITYGKVQFSEGFPVTKYKFGRINIIPRFGDANQNGNVTAADASYILQSVIGLVGAPPMILADVSNNGEIRAYDAALILKRLVNPSLKYPVESYYGLKQASAPPNKDVRILLTSNPLSSESDKTAEMNSNSVVYEISMKNVKEVWSAEMILDLGKGQKYTGYKLSSLSDRMTVQSRQEGTLLYLGMAGGEAITKDGLLLQIICQITDAELVKPIDIQQFILNESLIENIEGSLSGIPKTYALGQNYPNPFNPVTDIRYQIPNAGKITLTIYNILGQQVKTLVNATQQAGYYTIRWNGKDDAGINVASGVYFYRIRAGSFIQSKKMMFIK